MSKKDTEKKLTDIVLPIVENNGFELVDVEIVKEYKDLFLRIYIDKEGGILIDDCQLISSIISPKLDEYDLIKEKYFLEVSSPGLDRPLKTEKDFLKNKGTEIEIKLYKTIDNKKMFIGVLDEYTGEKIYISDKGGNKIEFDVNDVAMVKKVIKF